MKTINLLRRLTAVLVGIVLVGMLAFMQYDPAGLATQARLAVFDAYQRLHPRTYEDPSEKAGTGVVYVDVDRASLERLGPWPWPRTRFAALIDAASDAKARAVVFETPFEWPDPTSPREAVQEWLQSPDLDVEAILRLGDAAKPLPDHDAVLADAISRGTVVTAFSLVDETNDLVPLPKAAIRTDGGDARPHVPQRGGIGPSLLALEEPAAGNGARTLSTAGGQDGIIRKVPLLQQVSGALVPGLALEALRVAEQAKEISVTVSEGNDELAFGRKAGLQMIQVGSKRFPTDADGGLWLHYTERVATRRIPAWKLLVDNQDASQIENAIVFVATSAEGSQAFVETPLGTEIPRAAAHAQALEQMLTGHYLWRPAWAEPAEAVYLLLVGAALVAVLVLAGTSAGAAFLALGIGGAIAAGWYAFTEKVWLIDPSLASLGLILVFVTGALLNMMRSNATDKFIRTQFSGRLPGGRLNRLIREPSRAAPEGRRGDVTALATDVRGFHRVAEHFDSDPQGLARLVNQVHEPLSRCVLKHDGLVDRYTGDGMTALWNIPFQRDDHTEQACHAALRMVAEMEPVNRGLENEARAAHRPFKPISISIGIESGNAVIGNMGSQTRYDFSAIGGSVNEAEILQRLSRRYGPAIIVGAAARDRVKSRFALLEIDQLRLDGRIDPWRVYALLGDPIMRASPKFRALDEAHEAFFKVYRAREWAVARKILAECRALSGAIPTLYDLYEERIALFEQTPPPEGWQGVHEISDLLEPAGSRIRVGGHTDIEIVGASKPPAPEAPEAAPAQTAGDEEKPAS